MYLWSYIATALEGPGYLPYYYPVLPSPSKGNQPSYLEGVVTTPAQRKHIKSRPLPAGTHFCSRAQRIVIRPDHFCHWSSGFIGKKNYKLFCLFNLWGALYIFHFTRQAYRVIMMARHVHDRLHLLFGIINGLYMLPAAFFGFMQFGFFIPCMAGILFSYRYMPHLKREWAFSKDRLHMHNMCDSCQEVFGGKTAWWYALLPISPYHGVDEYLLVEDRLV
jgi:hypothetical protein